MPVEQVHYVRDGEVRVSERRRAFARGLSGQMPNYRGRIST
jgi:hypothetical protein